MPVLYSRPKMPLAIHRQTPTQPLKQAQHLYLLSVSLDTQAESVVTAASLTHANCQQRLWSRKMHCLLLKHLQPMAPL